MRLDSRTALYCPEFIHKTYAPNRFDLTLRLVEGENRIADEYKRLGQVHEAIVFARIIASKLVVVEISSSQSNLARELETAKTILRTDVDIILGASIGADTEAELRKALGDQCPGDSDRVSRPDVLVKIGVENGVPIWSPVDVKSHTPFSENKSNLITLTDLDLVEIPTKEPIQGRWSESDALQLAHYMTHLQNIGLAPHDLRAGIIGKDAEWIAWANLDQVTFGAGRNAFDAMTKYDQQFLDSRELVMKAQKRNDDPSVLVDSIARSRSGTYGCAKCDFKDVCLEEMESYDDGQGHVTLLARVTADAQRKHFSGIESIRDLRSATGLTDFGAKSQVRARVWQSKMPELLDPRQPLNIPKFDIEIDIDLENSQAALIEVGLDDVAGRDQVYLYGYGILDRTVNKDWRTGSFDSFSNYNDDESAEIDVLMRMWNFLKEQVAQAKTQNMTVGIFHYSPHERTWWRKFAERHAAVPGVPSLSEVEEFMQTYFVDLLEYSRALALPARGYGIKLLARLASFSWSVDDPGGAGSLLYYRDSVDATKSESERQEAKDWLYSYNLDDCRATFAVREYLRNLEV